MDIIYPKNNAKLISPIINRGGVIISEYIVGTIPKQRNFPERNRIISGLADDIIVIEAKEKSGSLITVDYALEQGKNIYAVPGNITSKNSYGTNKMIQDGAQIFTGLADFLLDI